MKNLIFILVLSVSIPAYAQHGFVSAGGSLENSGGNLSYSIGQTDYFTIESGDFYIQFGLQHMLASTAVDVPEYNHVSDDIEIYPNPSQGLFFVNLPRPADATGVLIEIINMQGNIIYEGIAKAGTRQQLDLTNQKSGIYIVRVVHDGNVSVARIVKR